MAWEKVVLPKSEGGLGVIDPALKAKVFHAQWYLRSLTPGSEPLKPLLRARMAMAQPVAGSASDWGWVMAESPSMPGIRTSSRLWRGIWAGWQLLRLHLKLKPPTCIDEVLVLPICGVSSIWSPDAERLCNRQGGLLPSLGLAPRHSICSGMQFIGGGILGPNC